jgi:hypothetical protein
MAIRKRLVMVAGVVGVVLSGPAWSASGQEGSPGSGTEFVRVVRDDQDRATALQTAIIHYVPADRNRGDMSVDLIGAVHVGDADYYARLNEEFENYDVVLYELVAPEGARVPRRGQAEADNPIAFLQNGLKGMLDLEHQLEQIDYEAENLVHADMSPEEFADSMNARGEDFMSILMRMMQQGAAQDGGGKQGLDVAELMAALSASNRPLALKRALAGQFENLEGMMAMFDGGQGSTIISERNKVALKALSEQLIDGEQNIAIFYGAGHLPDMEARLAQVFDLRPQDARWLTAWDLKEKKDRKQNRPGRDGN